MKTFNCIELHEGKKTIGKQEISLIRKLTATDNTGKTYRLGLPIPESKIKASEQHLTKVYILVNDFCVPFGTYRTLERTIKTIHINNIEDCFKKLSEGLLQDLENTLKPLFYNQEGYDAYIFTQAYKGNADLKEYLRNYKSDNKYAPMIKSYLEQLKHATGGALND